MRNERATLAEQHDSQQHLDFDGKLFVSADYWFAQMVDRAFAYKQPKPKLVTKPERPVFGRRRVA